jgi:hypothetical protein
MSDSSRYALLLRFRDLVTEPGGNIAEHRRIIKQRGYVWWGWWARQREQVPRKVLDEVFPSESSPTEIVLFDSGMMRLYLTRASKAVVAPSHLGVNSPDFEATPDYYVRGRYPAWFRLESDIVPLDASSAEVVARPTLAETLDVIDHSVAGESIDLATLRDEGPTLWVINSIGSK